MLKNTFKQNLLIISLFLLGAPLASATIYATRTQSTTPAIIIENLDRNSPQFKNLCEIALVEARKWVTMAQAPTYCITSSAELEGLKKLGNTMYGTTIQMTYHEPQLTLSFHSLTPEDSTYPIDVTKGDFNTKDENFVHALQYAIASYGAFDRNYTAIREHLIQNYVAAELMDAQREKPENKDKDPKEISLDQQNFNNAYADFNRENPENKRYIAANMMSTVILGIGTLNYYDKHNPKKTYADEDYRNFDQSIKDRADFAAWRFDDNPQLTNIGHMYAGTIHYTIARDSGLSRWDSLLHAFVLSSMWEYFSEFKQVVSINDQISTTLGGFIIGESFHQMAKILKKDGGGPVKHFLAKVLGSPEKVSQWAQNTRLHQEVAYDDDSLSTAQQDFWSKMDAYVRFEKFRGKTIASAGIESEIVNIPMFGKPGEVAGLLLDDTVQSQFKLEMSRGADINTFKLFAKTTLAAYYKKKMHLSDDDKLYGYQFFVGPAMMVDIDEVIADKKTSSPNSDIRGIIGVIGNTLDIRAVSGDLQFHAVMDVYGDFATVRSLAFNPATNNKYINVTAKGNCDGIQSVMCKFSYYYGIGWTEAAHFDLRYKSLTAGADYTKNSFHSIEGRSRFGESQRLNASDTYTKKGAWVAYEISRDVRVELGTERKTHISNYASKTITTKEAITTGRLIVKLD